MLVGLRIIIIIAIMGGIIAFLGDKIGTRVGKRRLSLFGLRPKHTSIIVTIITGLIISAATLTVLSISSESVRIALFGMTKLQAEMTALNGAIDEKNKELNASKDLLRKKNEELSAVNDKIAATQRDLERAQWARDEMEGQLITARQAYNAAEQRLGEAYKEVRSLEQAKKEMESHIESLQLTRLNLESDIKTLREGKVVFKNGEILSAAIIKPGLGEVEAQAVIANVLNDTNNLILRALHMQASGDVLAVSQSNVEDVAKRLAKAEEPMTVRIVAAANVVYGQPAIAQIQVLPHKLLYKQGEVILSKEIEGGDGAQDEVLLFLKEVNEKAKNAGVIPDPLTGTIGSVPSTQLFTFIEQLKHVSGPVTIKAVATENGYTDGPIEIHLAY